MLDGFVFDTRPITSKDWAHYNWVMARKRDGITGGCEMSVSGNDISIADGYFLIRGRMGVVRGTTVVSAPTVSSGQVYALLVAKIDLSQTNTASTMNQLTFEVKTNSSAYPTVTQQDLDDTGTIYELAFAKFTISSNGIENFEEVINEVAIDWVSESQFTFDSDTDSLYLTLS